jgi:hypothetical protein
VTISMPSLNLTPGRQRGRGSRERAALQLELAALTQLDELLVLGRRKRRADRLVLPAASLPVGHGDLVADRLAPSAIC